MIPWKVLARAQAPGGGTLVLAQRGEELAINVDGELLMSSRQSGSERAMAEAAELAAAPPGAAVLVGGLGFGYTLAAALALLGRGARVTVAELSDAVIAWNRGPAAHLAGRPLEDRRVTARCADVLAVVREANEAWDAILLDVDNGPWALSAPSNHGLYGPVGLASLLRALRPGGRLVVWSAGPEPRFTRRMTAAGFLARDLAVSAREGGGGRRGGRHTLFVGVRPEERDEGRGGPRRR